MSQTIERSKSRSYHLIDDVSIYLMIRKL